MLSPSLLSNNTFDELVFLYALLTRAEDAKHFHSFFQPEWLETVEYQPILDMFYSFLKEEKIPPSFQALHMYIEDKEPTAYAMRHKTVLESIEASTADTATCVYTLSKAKQVGIIRAFVGLVDTPMFESLVKDYDSQALVASLYEFLQQFSENSDSETHTIKKAIDSLVQTKGFDYHLTERYPIGIDVLDRWCSGGIKAGQLAILLAPTGHGKSVMLMNMAYYLSLQNIPVWFISNELTMEEQTSRFLSRMTGKPVDAVEDDPSIAYKGLKQYWMGGMDKNLKLTTFNTDVDTNEIENHLMTFTAIEGWKPQVIVLDFMERMAPVSRGYKRDKEWHWLGGVARDLSRLAKKHRMAIWTAAQTNRSGLSAPALTLSMAQASIRHLQEATLVVGAHQRKVTDTKGKEVEVLQLDPMKQRGSKKAFDSRYVEINLATMLIRNKEIDVASIDEEEEDNSTPKQQFSGSAPRTTKKKVTKKSRGKGSFGR